MRKLFIILVVFIVVAGCGEVTDQITEQDSLDWYNGTVMDMHLFLQEKGMAEIRDTFISYMENNDSTSIQEFMKSMDYDSLFTIYGGISSSLFKEKTGLKYPISGIPEMMNIIIFKNKREYKGYVYMHYDTLNFENRMSNMNFYGNDPSLTLTKNTYKNGSYEYSFAYRILKPLNGSVDLKSICRTLRYTIITKEMTDKPQVVLYDDDGNEIFNQNILKPSDSTEIDFGKLNLSNGVYYVTVRDSISDRITEAFVVRKKN